MFTDDGTDGTCTCNTRCLPSLLGFMGVAEKKMKNSSLQLDVAMANEAANVLCEMGTAVSQGAIAGLCDA